MSPVLRLVAYCSIAIWPASVLRFIHRQVPNIPYWDEWDEVPTFIALHNGTLTLGDMWATHNEHRVFFTRIVMIALDWFGGWDLVREMNLSVVVAMLSVILLTLLVRRTGPRWAWPFAGFLFSAVSFSFVQSENWAWGGTLSTFMVNACVVGVVVLLSRDRRVRRRDFAIAVGSAFIASYTLGQGLMIWVAGLVVLLCTPRPAVRRLMAWCLCACAAFWLYLYGMPQVSGHSLLGQLLSHPSESATYIFAYLGAPLGRWLGLYPAMTVGIFEFAAFMALSLTAIAGGKRDKRLVLRSSGWIGLGAFPLANALVTALGRVDLGVGQAESSRYTTTTLLLVIAIIGLVAARLRYQRPTFAGLAPAAACGALILGLDLACSNAAHTETIPALTLRKMAVAAIGKNDATSESLISHYLYPNPAVLRTELVTLQQLGQARSFAL